MKIKRPLINQLYEEDEQITQETESKPSFAYIKPLEQAKKELDAMEVTPEVVIQTKPSEEFLRKKAQLEAVQKKKLEQEAIELELKAKQEQELLNQELTKRELEKKKREEEQRIQKEIEYQRKQVEKQKAQEQKALVKPFPQMEFGIEPKHPSLKQRLAFIKLYFQRRQELLEISAMWKNPSLPFAIISIFFSMGLLFVGGILEFDRIPLKIPLFYNHVEKSWEQADKSAIFIMGIGLLVIEVALINIIIRIFRSDRRLALTLAWVITFINLLIIIAILQIYSLVT